MRKLLITFLAIPCFTSAWSNDEDFKEQYRYKANQELPSIETNLDQPLSSEEESRFNNFENDIKQAIGRIEVLEHAMTRLREDLDLLSNNIKQLANNQAVTQAPTPIIPAQKEENSDTPEADGAFAALGSESALSKNEQEKKAYDEALALLKEDKFEAAGDKFQKFMQAYPKSALSSNAYFWYAECFYRQKNYERAALYYLRGYTNYPKGNKAADSLLKLALSMGEINKTKEACDTLKKLEKTFPKRSEASKTRAKNAFNKFSCKK